MCIHQEKDSHCISYDTFCLGADSMKQKKNRALKLISHGYFLNADGNR